MFINVGQRTDIPAFYSNWFYNRIEEGFVYVRNPFYPKLVNEYSLSPKVVDGLLFCTKNPLPLINNPRFELLKPYRQFYFMTITGYGKDIEPDVLDKKLALEAFKKLSTLVGMKKVQWRYDPIIINEKYTVSYHQRAFEKICQSLTGYTEKCIFSFVDLYSKTKRNMPSIREVTQEERHQIAEAFSKIAKTYKIKLVSCLEDSWLSDYGIDTRGCFSKASLEEALDITIDLPSNYHMARKDCQCLLGGDIGQYNTCLHHCLYCYAVEDFKLAKKNYQKHDPKSPLLIGHLEKDDILKRASQTSWLSDRQLTLF